MTTRLDLRNLCRRRLGDLTAPYKWSDLQVNQWINDAIAEVSLHFPRLVTLEIETETGQQVYALPAGFRGVIHVEYPAGNDPQTYLQPRDPRSPRWAGSACYAVLRRRDATPDEEGEPANADELLLSIDPQDGETIRLAYLAEHSYLDDDADLNSVPERLLELLVLFVRWAAYQELAASESSDPDPTSLVSGTLELNAARAERLYRKQLQEALLAEGEGGVVEWEVERVY
jgi:hypothetical protein